MTIRAAFGVALAAALLAVSLPAVDQGRVAHSDATVAGEVARLERVATALVAENDPVAVDGPPARTRVILRLPERSWGDSGVAAFRVPDGGNRTDVVWRVNGGEQRRRRLPGVRLVGADGGLVLRDGGRHRLVVERGDAAGEPTAIVRRPTRSATGEE